MFDHFASYSNSSNASHFISLDNKIEESSQNLLNVIKRETKSIQKTLNAKNVP